MKRLIYSSTDLSREDKLNLRHVMHSIISYLWNKKDASDFHSGLSTKEKTLKDYQNSDYTSLSEYVMDHKQDIFPRGDIMMEIDEASRDHKNSYAVRQELLKIFDNYTERDFARGLYLHKDDPKKSTYVKSSYVSGESLENWCKTLPVKIHTLYLHYATGEIIGKMSVRKAVDTYGEAKVTNSYSDGDGQMSVWIIE